MTNTEDHNMSSLPMLGWNELGNDDLIRVMHKLTYDGDIWEPCAISFKDLCRALKAALVRDGAINSHARRILR